MGKRLTDHERSIRDSFLTPYPYDDATPAAIVRNWVTAGGRWSRLVAKVYLDDYKASELAEVIKANWIVEASAEAILEAVTEVRKEFQ